MPGDPLSRVDADRRDLPVAFRPHSRQPGPTLRCDIERSERVDQGCLQFTEIPVKIPLVLREIDDRIADELPGPMKRHVPSSLDLEQVDAGGQGDGDMLRFGGPAEGYDRRVLAE